MYTIPVMNHVRCAFPHSDLLHALSHFPQGSHILYAGNRDLWPLIDAAQQRPDCTFFGCNRDFKVVKKMRQVADVYTLSNITYQTTSLNNYRNKVLNSRMFDGALYLPPLRDDRVLREINSGRMRNLADCHDLLREGGTLVVHAALVDPAHCDNPIRDSVWEKVRDAFAKTEMSHECMVREVTQLRSGNIRDLVCFLLTHASRSYKTRYSEVCVGSCKHHVSIAPSGVRDSDDGIAEWTRVCVTSIDMCTRHVRGLDFGEVTFSTRLPQHLFEQWQKFFCLECADMLELDMSGTIVGKKI